MAADKTSVVSAAKTSVVSAAKKTATSDISISSTTLLWRRRHPCGVVAFIETSDVAAFLAADTTDIFAVAQAADGSFCPATS